MKLPKKVMLKKILPYFFVVLLGGAGAFLFVSLFGLALPLITLVFAPTAFFLHPLVSPGEKRTAWRKLILAVSIIITILGLFAPCRALMSFLIPHLEKGSNEFIVAVVSLPGAWFEIATGTAGVLFGLGYLSDGFWRMKAARQVIHLATSTAASASPGLSEFRGVARLREPLVYGNTPIPPGTVLFYPEAEIDNQGTDLLAEWDRTPVFRSFYLEDRSGRILVDPSHAVMRQSLFHKLLGSRACEIVLTRHKRREKRTVHGGETIEFVERWLEDGDPVYLIGNVEELREDPQAAGSSRLIVRVSPQARIVDSLLNRFNLDLFTRARRDIHDVFFLSDRDEASARGMMLTSAWLRFLLAILWITLSIILIGRADLVR